VPPVAKNTTNQTHGVFELRQTSQNTSKSSEKQKTSPNLTKLIKSALSGLKSRLIAISIA
jgi:hypothetical protein